jgi:hypothetical protein
MFKKALHSEIRFHYFNKFTLQLVSELKASAIRHINVSLMRYLDKKPLITVTAGPFWAKHKKELQLLKIKYLWDQQQNALGGSPQKTGLHVLKTK